MDISEQLERLASEIKTADKTATLLRKAIAGASDIVDLYIHLEEIAFQAVAMGGQRGNMAQALLNVLKDRVYETGDLEASLKELVNDAKALE